MAVAPRPLRTQEYLSGAHPVSRSNCWRWRESNPPPWERVLGGERGKMDIYLGTRLTGRDRFLPRVTLISCPALVLGTRRGTSQTVPIITVDSGDNPSQSMAPKSLRPVR